MAWIETIPFTDATGTVRRAYEMQQELYPIEYAPPDDPVENGQTESIVENGQTESIVENGQNESIVETHSLIPSALYHAFATYGVLLSPDLPLSRRQHEMIATMVSEKNRCKH